MKSPSLDNLYIQLEKHILLAQSYTEIKELEFLIKACRLKPHDFLNDRNKSLKLHRWWVDEFGNSLKIDKNKRLKIIYNDLSIKNSTACTDLYYGLSMDRIAKMSKLIYLCGGKDEDLYQNCFTITFLGIDNYLRSYMFLYDKWQSISPLLLGVKGLKIIANHLDIKRFLRVKNKENMLIHCTTPETWLSFMPPSDEFLDEMRKQHRLIYDIINIKGNNIND